MPGFRVTTLDGDYERNISTFDAASAAELWAAWYCPHTTEYGPEIECLVWLGSQCTRMVVTVESTPVYSATEID